MPEHTAHRPTRLVSRADDGRAVYGCAHPGCAFTEVRHRGQPSPVITRRAARRASRKQRGGA